MKSQFSVMSDSMTTVEEVSEALHRLPALERWDLLRRFSDEVWSHWDKQIESDLRGGRLNGLRADIAAGRTRYLDEVLNND